MSSSAIASEVSSPYAQALMGLAKDQGLTEQFGAEAAALQELLSNSAELRQFLTSPLVSRQSQKAVLAQLGAERFHPLFVNFLKLLVDRGRITFLGAVLTQYQALLRELNQTVLAEVTAAIALTEAQEQAIRDRVVAMTNARQVDITLTLDPDLLGGVIIRVGSQIIDASLRGQLRRMAVQLGGAA